MKNNIFNSIQTDKPFCIFQKEDSVAIVQGHIQELNYLDEICDHSGPLPIKSISMIPFCQIKERGFKVKVGKFPFSASGKAIALDDHEGMVKLVVDQEFGELLGAHIVGPEASELLSEISVAKQLEYSAEDIARTVHAHPTLSEAIMEAALAAGDGSIHI